jgi:hypothetical protein
MGTRLLNEHHWDIGGTFPTSANPALHLRIAVRIDSGDEPSATQKDPRSRRGGRNKIHPVGMANEIGKSLGLGVVSKFARRSN